MSTKDYRFVRVVRITVSNRRPAGRQVALVDAASLSFAEPDGTSSSPPMSGRARPTPLRRLLDVADFYLGQRQLVAHRVDPPICCSGNYSMLCSWVAEGGRMIFDQTLRARSCCQTIYPDAFSGLAGGHKWVVHSAEEYARGDCHVNTCESFFALIKRGVYGIYHNVSKKHLHRYVAKFAFRFNGRKLDDGERTAAAIRGAVGKRLYYKVPAA